MKNGVGGGGGGVGFGFLKGRWRFKGVRIYLHLCNILDNIFQIQL